MPDKLSPETERRIRDLCGKISVALNLDPEGQRELSALMEKKLQAYLSGGEKLSEEDALLLVREHFGDPEVIKTMLQSVHFTAAGASLARRIGAILALTLFAGLAGYCLQLGLRLGNLAIFGNAGLFLGWKESFALLCEAALFAGVLLHWRKRLRRGEKPWFLTAGPFTFAGVITALLCLDTLIPFLVCLDVPRLLNIPPGMLSEMQGLGTYRENHHLSLYWQMLSLFKPISPSTFSGILYGILSLAYTIFQCAAWFWWCADSTRNRSGIVLTAGAWALFTFLITTFQPAPMFPWDRTAGQFVFRVDWNNMVSDVPGLFYGYVFFLVLAYVLYGLLSLASARPVGRGEKHPSGPPLREANTLVSFSRSLGAIAIVYLGVEAVKWGYLTLSDRVLSPGAVYHRAAEPLLALGFLAFSLLLPWIMLLSWRGRMDDGRRVWFATLSPLVFLSAILFLGILLPGPVLSRGSVEGFLHVMYTSGNFWNVMTPLIFQCLVWLWWLDHAQKRKGGMVYAAFAWMGYNTLVSLLQHFNLISTQFRGPEFIVPVIGYSAVPAVLSLGLYMLSRRIGLFGGENAHPVLT